ncbi:peptidase S9 [Leptolyngbya sp. 'hensonii']|uniref:alpha/beta hydrolase family protein n=1 Tax=Leptolyngbya sp. 'hensonii' TaxID=1922337 RepID=UPI00094F4C23|nr:prolyl oligopeptidase family serine peptidase [Leptolyngbya sp. 'hensonii']OLP18546.1 peptidase S9 [Leptolyngbya sp. 'hensonii']
MLKPVAAQVTWQSPPPPIDQILNAPPPPVVLFSPYHEWMVQLEQPALPALSELAEPEIALGGFQINPKTNGPNRQFTYRNLGVKSISSDPVTLLPLPEGARIDFLKWSLDGQRLAFTLTQEQGLELWVVDLRDRVPHRLTGPILNATYGDPYEWLPGEAGLLCKVVPGDRGPAPVENPVPIGPLVQENLGRKTPTRTYTNLLESPHDEALFEYYLTSRLERIGLDGQRTLMMESALIDEAIPSPDGNYILLTTFHRPFSYQVPAYLFPKQVQVLDFTGRALYQVADLPLADDLSIKFDSVRPGRRKVNWRADQPATLFWVEALDGGDASQEAALRDRLYELAAPFTAAPTQLWQSEYRFRQILWGQSDVALAWEIWYDSRRIRIWQLNPNQPSRLPRLLVDRSYEDQYSDPGMPMTTTGVYGWEVLRLTPDGLGLYLNGRGASPAGVYPFLDQINLETGQKQRLWQAKDPYFEGVVEILDDRGQTLITRRQSQQEPPNYFLRQLQRDQVIQLTDYRDPAPQFTTVRKELIRYQRADGVQLSGTLHLPPGYEPKRDGPLPTIFWVYPTEFKDRDSAGQVTTASNAFSRPRRTSVLFLLTQGYAVLDNPSLPIVGEGKTEPNDTYIEQLVAGAKAAVTYLVDRGIADPQRLGIGGHSYGAFTTANLLAHSDLFRAGVAMSGAYNRTLTPFGFQGEQRSFWDAAETYIQMSPFTVAAKIKEPLLLIHGANDSNPGTYPIQTERFYEALKGLGSTVRWVVLPLEDHGYRSREAIGHTLWEMIRWYDQYVKSDPVSR